ncbi:DUF3006 family protein [Pontibacillus yanchengensis]|uniref:DUF3006 family protein n=2 Tax=Pontibacillus yanchengensis TaxID=462910 RepID=A0ACC7VEA4_9BACI|nr:DUF3006 domain-containing protein [Pontibacillus yanchengensis]MYL34305.1 DUF3006 family protein [Pontibacillus yanchengensis]MYL53773.1 DUF3006 family protein [Pontibacillus yanchengensis]
MKYTIDRFEGDKAILLQKGDETKSIEVNLNQLPNEAKQGDIVNLTETEDNFIIEILEEETANRKKQMNDMLERLNKKNGPQS